MQLQLESLGQSKKKKKNLNAQILHHANEIEISPVCGRGECLRKKKSEGSYFYKNFPKSSWCAATNAKHGIKECSKKRHGTATFCKVLRVPIQSSMKTTIQKWAKTRKCFQMVLDISYLSPKTNVSTCIGFHRKG